VEAVCPSAAFWRESQLTKARRRDFWERGRAEETIRQTSSSFYKGPSITPSCHRKLREQRHMLAIQDGNTVRESQTVLPSHVETML
jgi:hypothetical protein